MCEIPKRTLSNLSLPCWWDRKEKLKLEMFPVAYARSYSSFLEMKMFSSHSWKKTSRFCLRTSSDLVWEIPVDILAQFLQCEQVNNQLCLLQKLLHVKWEMFCSKTFASHGQGLWSLLRAKINSFYLRFQTNGISLFCMVLPVAKFV